ncbi:hypothetical protein GCK72_022549 [Caenorhabditis remanei]|uniref:Uncharacterized protein n=1 Tax=Caenorhabditis remanei TaxID=31234 RepID=A0A6A5FU37_CAERE|nr:hypothetical protein GCK72_022549 [Caenorhabditis remanei]KAF1746097.1 hypothetical protein GCK72_022549 [Caenorhabditis remanei]
MASKTTFSKNERRNKRTVTSNELIYHLLNPSVCVGVAIFWAPVYLKWEKPREYCQLSKWNTNLVLTFVDFQFELSGSAAATNTTQWVNGYHSHFVDVDTNDWLNGKNGTKSLKNYLFVKKTDEEAWKERTAYQIKKFGNQFRPADTSD